jgi:predicted nucleic acid-binding protein
MANLVLPDSNFYINCARAGTDPFRQLGARSDDYEFATCGMVVLEVCRGIRFPKDLQRVREQFGVMIFIPTSNQIWERATQLAWSLDRQGAVIPAQDVLIAAHALQTNATVLTFDAHFHAISGLRVVDHLT